MRVGLALSGGGFRATLFHLGAIRHLREAGILPHITHICSVSGGSILAAHLVLRWKDYTGEDEAFDAAAKELCSFVRQDIRGKIVRRMPLTVPLSFLGRRLGLSKKLRISRTDLLERYYDRYLYDHKDEFLIEYHKYVE